MTGLNSFVPRTWWKWQESVVRKERVSHLQALARGIAHDVRNGVTPIMGYTELIQGYLEQAEHQERLHFLVDSLAGATKGIEGLLDEIRAFYRPVSRTLPKESTPLKALVESVASRIFSENSFRWKVAIPEEAVIWIEPEILEQLLKEILKNASDAMKDSGQEVIISLTAIKALPEFSNSERIMWGDISDDHPSIVIEDTGEGASEETIRFSIEPFFMGEAGKRNGIGLGRVWGMMDSFNGGLAISSVVNQGTRVELHFPSGYFNSSYPTECICNLFSCKLKGVGLTPQEKEDIEREFMRSIVIVPQIEDLFTQGLYERLNCWIWGSPISEVMFTALDETLLRLSHMKMYILLRSDGKNRHSHSGKIHYWKTIEDLKVLKALKEY